jgi:DNA-binding NarL/FixJ family response regulator
MTIRVVLADDQALIRAGFKALIDSANDLTVVGEISLRPRIQPRNTPPQVRTGRHQPV